MLHHATGSDLASVFVLHLQKREYHPTHWESHCGAGAAKKWKASIKVSVAALVWVGAYGRWCGMPN